MEVQENPGLAQVLLAELEPGFSPQAQHSFITLAGQRGVGLAGVCVSGVGGREHGPTSPGGVEAHPSRANQVLWEPWRIQRVARGHRTSWGLGDGPSQAVYLDRVHFLLEEKIFVFLCCFFPFTQIRNQIPSDKPS